MGSSSMIQSATVNLSSLFKQFNQFNPFNLDEKGCLFTLYGHSEVHPLAQRFLATSPLLHGWGSMVLDAGNRFDPYLITLMAQTLGREPREFLSRILVSRSFTCHQTHALIQRLSRICASGRGDPPRVVLVLGCLVTFYDEDVPLGERALLLRKTLLLLKRVSKRGTKVLVTSTDPPLNVPGRFMDLLLEASDGAARVGLDPNGSLRIEAVKGMNRLGISRR